jgi:hypothetical protein
VFRRTTTLRRAAGGGATRSSPRSATWSSPVSARSGGDVERICLRALDRGQCVLSWQGNNSSLAAAGAIAIDERDVERGLRLLCGGNSPRSPAAGGYGHERRGGNRARLTRLRAVSSKILISRGVKRRMR